ncbi:MAG: glutamate-1-semialdehyde 2,1-aminomutase [Planctomycetota bacterium]
MTGASSSRCASSQSAGRTTRPRSGERGASRQPRGAKRERGQLILGHAPAAVLKAVAEAAERGTSFGAPTAAEVDLAEFVAKAFPSVEMVRLVSSGTEATMSAIRLARGFTGRSKLVKFDGGYHGHADGLLVKAGSGAATLSIPGSAGVPPGYAAETLVANYNDLPSVEALFREHGVDIACIIVEPVAGNMGVVPPGEGFLEGLRGICDRAGALLIFDEVITGFRVAFGGMQERSGVRADLTTLGKILGGGLPVGAYGGRREVMQRLAPLGDVYQAGTLSGNPLATAAGLATLRALESGDVYGKLEKLGEALEAGLKGAAAGAGVPVTVNRVGSMMTLFFTDSPVTDYASAQRSDTERYVKWFRAMLARGVSLPPSQFEAFFVSTAHTDADIALTVREAGEAMGELA